MRSTHNDTISKKSLYATLVLVMIMLPVCYSFDTVNSISLMPGSNGISVSLYTASNSVKININALPININAVDTLGLPGALSCIDGNFTIALNNTDFNMTGSYTSQRMGLGILDSLKALLAPYVGMAYLANPANITLRLKANTVRSHESSSTVLSGKAGIYIETGLAAGYYKVVFKMAKNSVMGFIQSKLHVFVTHYYTGANGSKTEYNTGRTVIYMESFESNGNGSTVLRRKTIITTDDYADWALFNGFGMLMDHLGANVTFPSQGELPVPGKRNVTLIIEDKGQISFDLDFLNNPLIIKILNESTETHITVGLTYGNGYYKVSIHVYSLGNYSNGISFGNSGINVSYLKLNALCKPGTPSETLLSGLVELNAGSPIGLFLYVNKMLEKIGNKTYWRPETVFAIISEDPEFQFIMNGRQYRKIVFTESNYTLLGMIGLKQNNTLIEWNGDNLIYTTREKGVVNIVLPSTVDARRIIVKAPGADKVVLVPYGTVLVEGGLSVKILFSGNSTLLLNFVGPVRMDSPLTISTINPEEFGATVPMNMTILDPAYNITGKLPSPLILGLKVNHAVSGDIKVLSIHGDNYTILQPFQQANGSGVIYIVADNPGLFLVVTSNLQKSTTSASITGKSQTGGKGIQTSHRSREGQETNTVRTSSSSLKITSSTGSVASKGRITIALTLVILVIIAALYFMLRP